MCIKLLVHTFQSTTLSTNLSHEIQQNDVHGSILLTEGTKTELVVSAHIRVPTQRAGKPSMSLTSAKARVVCA